MAEVEEKAQKIIRAKVIKKQAHLMFSCKEVDEKDTEKEDAKEFMTMDRSMKAAEGDIVEVQMTNPTDPSKGGWITKVIAKAEAE